MSSAGAARLTAPDIMARKGTHKIVCLTAYTAPMAGASPDCDGQGLVTDDRLRLFDWRRARAGLTGKRVGPREGQNRRSSDNR
jgi:ketopantoate hydroxymethyltransferase